MKTNWPNDVIDRELAARDPEDGSRSAPSTTVDDPRVLLERILVVDPDTIRPQGYPLSSTLGRTNVRTGWHATPRVALAGLGAVALVAAVVAISITTTGSRTPGPISHPPKLDAATVLKHASLVADEQPAFPALQPGQFIYTDEIDSNLVSTEGPDSDHMPSQPYTVLQPETRQIWISPDGSGRLAESYGSPTFLTPADKARWIQAGSPPLTDGHLPPDVSGGPGTLYFVNMSQLPTNPSVLKALLDNGRLDDGGLETHPPGSPNGPYTYPTPGPAKEFEDVGDLLSETYASPQLRAALYQVAATLPGVELVGTVTDDQGRTGTAVAYASQGVRTELIFDPTTSALLEERVVVTDSSKIGPSSGVPPHDNIPAGTVVQNTIYVTLGVVDSTSSTTPGTAAPSSS